MLKPALIAIAALFMTGCTSLYVYPDPENVRQGDTVATGLSGLVLGVERKQDELGVVIPPGELEAPYDLQTLVDALNEYQVFKRTAYLDELDVRPDLILSHYRPAQPGFRALHGERGGFLCTGYYYPISFATLTILPIYCSSEETVSFTLSRPEDSAQNAVQFHRQSKQLMGVWAPVAAKLNPSWRSMGSGTEGEKHARAELTRRYKKFVVQQFRELIPVGGHVEAGR